MHPTAILLGWLAGLVSVQYLDYPGLLLLSGVALSVNGSVLSAWLVYLRRARWLLLTLWLILAFNTPGDALRDLDWAPTYQGVHEANLQAVRLVAMLALLAWLFGRLALDGLVSALWGLMHPLGKLGLDVERLVVRLSIVMNNLQVGQEKGAWRNILSDHATMFSGPAVLRLVAPRWKVADTLAVLTVIGLLLGVIVL